VRSDGRDLDELRPCTVEPGYVGQALGSALVTTGGTRVICTASAESRVPSWLAQGGWVTAQYAMLPGATRPRGSRDPGGRGKEIQRLIGRALRAAVDLRALDGPRGPISLVCDCDVIEADGGTRTASVVGAYVALRLALSDLERQGFLVRDPVRAAVTAVSVGLVPPEGGGDPVAMLDLCYEEDSRAHVDLNVVRLVTGGIVEVQGGAERGSFSRAELDALLDLAGVGLDRLAAIQSAALGQA
jgi:ribonuclease PH